MKPRIVKDSKPKDELTVLPTADNFCWTEGRIMGILNMIKYSCCGLFYKKGAAIWQTGFHLTVLLLKTQNLRSK